MSHLDSHVPRDSSAELMRRAAGGDYEAFERLHDRFCQALRYFLAKRGADPDLCEDLAQKIFTSLWQRRKDFRAKSSIETYLFGIARNVLSNEMRRSRMSETGLRNNARCRGQSRNGLSQPEAELYFKELAGAVEEAIGKLTEGQRQALDAFGAVDSSRREASAKSDCSDATYRARLKRARKKMRKLLARFLNDDDDADAT